MSALEPRIQVAIARTRDEVARLHVLLVRNNLVSWTGGNISARVPGSELFVIKPSGVPHAQLSPENLILCDLDGEVVPNTPGWLRNPSRDSTAHAYVYQHLPSVGGIVHTHSTFATEWAARGEAIPCATVTMAAEFGGEIPVGPFAVVGDESLGREIVTTLQGQRSPAVLMQNHGLFSVGSNAAAAFRTAVLAEDAARTMHVARELGELAVMSPEGVDEFFFHGSEDRDGAVIGAVR